MAFMLNLEDSPNVEYLTSTASSRDPTHYPMALRRHRQTLTDPSHARTVFNHGMYIFPSKHMTLSYLLFITDFIVHFVGDKSSNLEEQLK